MRNFSQAKRLRENKKHRLCLAIFPLLGCLAALLNPAPSVVLGKPSLGTGSAGLHLGMAHKGLGPEGKVPGWAKERSIHFIPGHGSSHFKQEKVHTELGRRCSPESCPSVPLEYRGGLVQHFPHVYVIFWGANWSTYWLQRETVQAMYDGLSGSPWQGTLTQYFDKAGLISPGVTRTYYIDSSVSAPSQVTDEKIEQEVIAARNANGWPADPDDQFAVVTAPGSTYDSSFASGGFCAYHTFHASKANVSYTFVPYVGDQPFYDYCSGYDVHHNATYVTSMLASHEYAESATDPNPGNPGWLDSEGYEVADICASGVDELPIGNPAYVQGLWDNYKNQCSDGDSGPYPRSWHSGDNLGGSITSDPDVSSWGDNRLDVFAKGATNSLMHKYWINGVGWSGWENLGGSLASGPAAVSWGPGRIDVVARATDNSVTHWYWNGSWHSDNLGGSITSDPDIASWGENRLDVFAKGSTNTLMHKYWNYGSWSGWEDMGGSLTSGPGAVSWGLNRIDVVARATDNSVTHWYWNGSWHSDNLGGNITSDPDMAAWGENRLDVFAKGTGNTLWHKYWNYGSWSGWENMGGSLLASGPGAVSWGLNRIDVFARSLDNSVSHWWWG
jgi:repeat uncharacterized protein DUF346